MSQMPPSRRAAFPVGLALALAVGSVGPASADHGFKDCAIVDHSHASPFVQSRAQLTLLNLISSGGDACNLIEFRIAEIAKLPTVADKDGVRRRWWMELWGLNQCGAAKVYEVWFQEIGLGGVSFSAELLEDPPADFVARMAANTPLPPDQLAVTEEDGPPRKTAGADIEADYLAIARAAIAAKDAAKAVVATPPASGNSDDATEAAYLAIAKAAVAGGGEDKTVIADPAGDEEPAADTEKTAETGATVRMEPTADADTDATTNGPLFPGRELKFKSPNFKGHDVCAIQRALIGAEISVGVDGHYGPGMKRGVAKFQKRHGLKGTGVFDEKTRAALSFPKAGKSGEEKEVAKKAEQ